MARPASDEAERFLSKVKPGNSGCHEWQAGLNRGGYGKIYFRGRCSYPAHRVAHQLFVGEIPQGLAVLHRCDNRKCVNPEHLFIGTGADNIADMDAKGRRGSRSKLSNTDAQAIKWCVAAGMSQERTGHLFGIDQTTVSKIWLGRTTRFQKEH